MNTLEDMFERLAGKEPAVKDEHSIAVPEPPGERGMQPAERMAVQLAEAESRLYDKAIAGLDAALATFELTDKELQSPEPPPRWVRKCGGDMDRAREQFNIARHARMNKKDAPVFFDIASKVHTTVSRARAAEKMKNLPLNAIVVNMTLSAPPEFEEREVIETEAQEDWGDV